MKPVAKVPAGARGGFALLVVLVVLLALLVLAAPFLWTAGKVEEGSARLESTALARHGLDTAARAARHSLGASHPALDSTPDFDDAQELGLDQPWNGDWLPADERGALLHHGVSDLSARLDLQSASPQAIANLLGVSTYLLSPVGDADEELPVADARGFPLAGYLWIDGEIVRYESRTDRAFRKLTRGLLHRESESCGPSAARGHGLGTPVLGQEAWAIPMWRTQEGWERGPGAARPAALSEAGAFSLSGGFTPEQIERLERLGTFYGGVAAPGPWQRAVRILEDTTGGSSCTLLVSEPRFVSPGSTVLLRQGPVSELALVARVGGNGRVVLLNPMRYSYAGGQGELLVLAARAVNVNTAPPEVLAALLENVSLSGVNERVSASEARELAARLAEGRPWTGFADILERCILPAAGLVIRVPGSEAPRPLDPSAPRPLISIQDAQALYRNFENANNAELRFSTAPIRFASGDVYELTLRSAHNAPSGVLRAFAERVQTERVVPPGPLLAVWARQVEFDELLRLDREAPGWATGPASTSAFDGRFGASPPPRRRAHFPLPQEREGEAPAVEVPIVPTTSGPAWVRPWPSRQDEEGQRAGRVLHFDREPSDSEGRALRAGALRFAADDQRIAWVDEDGLARPVQFSLWLRPDALADGAYLLDVAGTSRESDRISLRIEAGDLVLEAIDGVGDHPGTGLVEHGQVRVPLAGDGGPALAPGTWSHVEIDVRGNRPDQLAVRLDGFPAGRTPGLTRLLSPLGSGDATLQVESTEGFPDAAVLRVGNELIEAVRSGPNTFDATRITQGPRAGFGGRIAREIFDFQPQVALNTGLAKPDNHPAGAAVSLYGYSLPLASNAPPGQSALPDALGAFAVARVVGVDGTSNPLGSPVSIQFPVAGAIEIGTGFEGGAGGATGLLLGPADPLHTQAQVESAFPSGGGFAAILQQIRGFQVLSTGESTNAPDSSLGLPMFGVEIVRYSSRQGNLLQVAQWGVDSSTLPNLATAVPPLGTIGGSRAFVVAWGGSVQNFETLLNDLSSRVFVVPISVPAPGAEGGFLDAQVGASQFAQLTRVADAEQTEWLRYDSITAGQLVRDDPAALRALWLAVTRGFGVQIPAQPPPAGGGSGGSGSPGGSGPPAPGGGAGGTSPGGGGGNPGGGIGGGAGGGAAQMLAPLGAFGASAQGLAFFPWAAALSQQSSAQGGAYWQPELGVPRDDNFPLTRAARTAFEFRGVLGTFSQFHPAGTLILPVVRLVDNKGLEPSQGRPGRLDHGFLVDASPTDPGWPVVVHRAYRPNNRLVHAWEPGPGLLSSSALPSITAPEVGFDVGGVYVAFQEAVRVPIASGTLGNPAEARTTARLVLFPSGERPRGVAQVSIGRAFDGSGPLEGVVDEVLFGGSTLGPSFGYGVASEGAALVLREELTDGGTLMRVLPRTLRLPLGNVPLPSDALSALPPDGGVLRVGLEWIAYRSYDAALGEFTIAPGGRGLLGTEARSHGAGQSVVFLGHITTTTLSAPVAEGDGFLPVADLTEFPAEGTVLVGAELIHHTERRNGALAMPRRASSPGARDSAGDGIYRGRFGTRAAAHPVGTAVIQFPFRYYDRFAEAADVPEQHYFQFRLAEPDAFVLRAFLEHQPAPSGGVELRVLERTDPAVPWDSDPFTTEGLTLWRAADLPPGGRTISAPTSLVEWRVHAHYRAGAFDALRGSSPAWKEAPQLSLFGAEYLAPGRILRAEER